MGSRSGYNWSWQVDKVNRLKESNTPLELIEFQKKWEQKFNELTLEPAWPEKYAGFIFEYRGENYVVYAADFGVSNSVFALLSREMEDELVDMDAEKVFYTGMLD
ncbi:MAG: hypothetical protein BWY11_00095 [Firmicutes bacterium ADurb.Bin182]|nr:MAG: hypothetical protein BWY11_00095 [Firmicutes bacterium ADurb.Bin182]